MKFQPFLCALVVAAALALGADAPPQRTELTADDVDLKTVGNETRVICLRGKDEPVVLTGTNLKITCDRLEIIALGVGDKTSVAPVLEKFKYLLATGHVHMVQGDREAFCGRAEVFPIEDKIVLTEDPKIVDHGGDIRREEEVVVNGVREKRVVIDHSNHTELQDAERMEMFRGERHVHIVKGKLSAAPLKDLGFDPKQPAPKSAPAPAEKSETKK
jgi:lipopolysaccharide export system protein LptA